MTNDMHISAALPGYRLSATGSYLCVLAYPVWIFFLQQLRPSNKRQKKILYFGLHLFCLWSCKKKKMFVTAARHFQPIQVVLIWCFAHMWLGSDFFSMTVWTAEWTWNPKYSKSGLNIVATSYLDYKSKTDATSVLNTTSVWTCNFSAALDQYSVGVCTGGRVDKIR